MKRSPFIVAYDVVEPGRRADVHRAVTAWAHGGQKSVFECWAAARETDALKAAVAAPLDPRTDRLAVLALPPAGPFIALGRGRTPRLDRLLYVG